MFIFYSKNCMKIEVVIKYINLMIAYVLKIKFWCQIMEQLWFQF